MRKLLKNRDLLLLLLLLIIQTIIWYILNDYPKTLGTYNDEALYLNMARSIHEGGTLRMWGEEYFFSNLLYPYILSIAFFIKNTIIRIKFITLINAFLMSLSIVPEYLICRELKLGKSTWIVIAIIMTWPDMALSGSLMCENLYFPLSIFAFYFIVRALKYGKLIDNIIAALVTYLAYFCKEVALCIPVAYIVTQIICSVYETMSFKRKYGLDDCYAERKKEKIRSIVKRTIPWLAYAAFFFGIRTLMKAFLDGWSYVGSVNFNVNSSVGNVDASNGIMNPITKFDIFSYWSYAIFYYVLLIIIVFSLLMIIKPLFQIDRLDLAAKKTYGFGIVLLAVTIVVIATTISIHEYFGALKINAHLRYLSSLIGIFAPLIILVLKENRGVTKKQYVGELIFSIMLLSLLALFFKGTIQQDFVSGCTISIVSILGKHGISNALGIGNVYGVAVIISFVLFVFCLIILEFQRHKNHYTHILYALCIISISVINAISSYDNIKWWYSSEQEGINEMHEIDEYLSEFKPEKVALLYDSTDNFEALKVYDLYFDSSSTEYILNIDSINEVLYNTSSADSIFDANGTPVIKGYNDINYLIVPNYNDEFIKRLIGFEKVSDVAGKNYYLLKNEDYRTFLLEQNSVGVSD